jgi:hypothetical protein
LLADLRGLGFLVGFELLQFLLGAGAVVGSFVLLFRSELAGEFSNVDGDSPPC